MRLKLKSITLILFCLFLFPPCWGQEKALLSAGQKGMSFLSFTKELEQNYNIQFFFKEEWVKELELQQSYKNKSLEEIVKSILQNTGLKFFIRDNFVVLTQNKNVNFSEYFTKSSPDVVYSSTTDETKAQIKSLQEEEFRIHEIGVYTDSKKVKLYGQVLHFESQTPLAGVEVYIPGSGQGVTTDEKGNYLLHLKPESYIIHYKYLGLKPTHRKIKLKGSGRIDIQLINQTKEIREVKITAKNDRVKRVKMGLDQINIKDIKSLPTALGEPDIVKSTTMLPGVESAGEGTIGFNVRGGSADQNLILIDNAPIYYPAHFFGFFSPFNHDMVLEANLYKASIPAQYGGRLSSVYDIQTKENGVDKLGGKAGLSPVSSKLYLEIPIVKDKINLFHSSRITYSDWVLKQIETKELLDSKVDFYDLHGKLSFNLNPKNKISLSYYKSEDNFKLHSDSLYKFSNFMGSFNWRKRINEKYKLTSSAYFSRFSYHLATREVPENSFEISHAVQEIGLKSFLTYDLNPFTSFDWGASLKYYSVNPGKIQANSIISQVSQFTINREKALETVLFANAKYNLFQWLTAETGIRYSLFGNLGTRKEINYWNNIPSAINSMDTVSRRGINNIYSGPEFRMNLSFALNPTTSIKASYNRTQQYIHLLSNSIAISPTDNWKLSDKYLKPQIGDQISVGWYKNLPKYHTNISIEAYYKKIQNSKDYKDGAQLLLKEHLETEIINGAGKNYGIEFLVKRKIGRTNGTFSYTYSRSFFKSPDKSGEFAINEGEYYSSPLDKPHNFKLFLNFNLSRRFILSTNMVYHSGKPVTYPESKFYFENFHILNYSKRNKYRLPDYFRTDISILMEGNLKKNKKFHTYYSFGIYNITSRQNAYSVYFRATNHNLIGYKLSIFGRAIPTFSYNIEF